MARIFIILLCFAFFPSGAQNLNVINLKNGLSNNYVECILQDKQGYIWIGTRDGLNRCNGYEVEIFRQQLPSSFIYSLFQDSDDKIWIGTSQGGVSIYDPVSETFRTLARTHQNYAALANKDVYTFFEDHDHNMWIGTLQGLALIPSGRDTLLWYEQKIEGFDHMFTSICQNYQNKLFFGTNRGLYTTDGELKALELRKVEFDNQRPLFIRDLLLDHKEKLWIATDNNSVLVADLHDNKILSATRNNERSNQAWSLYTNAQHEVWASFINKGVFRYDSLKNVFVPYSHRALESFHVKSVTQVLEDRAGNLWIASHGDGVFYFNPKKYVFEKYLAGSGYEAEERSKKVSSIFQDSKGKLWIGTDGDGLYQFDPKESIAAYQNRLSSDIILDIVEDADGKKWLATWQGGVNVIAPNGAVTKFQEAQHTPFGLKNSNVKALLRDRSDNIWIVTHGGGISIYSTTEKRFVDPSSIKKGFRDDLALWGSDILQANNGDVWVASHAGLFRFHNDEVLEYFATGQPGALASVLVYCLYEDHNGDIWIGTNTSLERFNSKTNKFENFTQLHGIPGNIKCIQEDKRHRLWISTVHEVFQLDPKTGRVRHFDNKYNLQQGQFYECACMQTPEGKMYFGGTEGFNAFWPDSIAKESAADEVLITDLYLFNKRQQPDSINGFLTRSLSFTKELTLPYHQNVLSVQFLTITFPADNKIRYSYKLQGFDQQWSPPSKTRTATYTNLDPGKYVFMIRADLGDERATTETQLRIRIVPPFWKTWWFRVLSTLGVILLIVGYLLLRLYSSRQKRLKLQQLVAERTKEINEKNIQLQSQKADLENKNASLISQEIKIRDQADTLSVQKEMLQANNRALQDLVATKDRLFSIIAHDLRNPFTSILGFSKLLNTELHRYSDEEKAQIIQSLYHSSNSVYSLLENLLAWSKSQQQIVIFSPEELSFYSLMDEHFDLIRDEAGKKHVHLTLSTNEDVKFFADRNMLNVIIRNLLSNAMRHSPMNGRIEAGYQLAGRGLSLYISDEGIGVEDSESLFIVGSHELNHRDHNHGLGLILCKEFVEKHGGTIKGVNNPSKGARFIFTLPESNPRILSQAEPRKTISDRTDHNQTPEEALPIILVAEDDDDIRWYIRQVLHPDHAVIEAVNGLDAKKLAVEKVPDLVISDLNMPGVNGLDFCHWVKNQQQTCHIPFVLLTAERGSDKKVSGYQSGADDYITKPIDADVLRARVQSIIAGRRKLKAIYRENISAEPENFTTNTLDQEFLKKLNAIIEKRINDDTLNPDNLATEMNMSRTGLYMKIKGLTGESVGIYVRNVRLNEARKLLKSRKMNVSEVAYAVGFNQLPYFTTCFKEAFGITPSEYTNSLKV